jgi:hypothetical protein
VSNTWLSLTLALAATCGCCVASMAADGAACLQWRGVWEWTMPRSTPADLIRVADTAHALGFNALIMSPPRDLLASMRQCCHERGLRLYLSTVFAGGEPEWQQVLRPAERERLAHLTPPFPATYQEGGEPLAPDELYSGPLPCWNRPEVREHFTRLVTEYAQLPVDGLGLDAVGYVNFDRCYCSACEAKLAQFRAAHPRLTRRAAEAAFAEETLVDFTNTMAATARQSRPDISLTLHNYPHFRPHPYYGNRLDVDYVGQTVAWFFPPHWPMGKVARLSREIVATQAEYWPHSLSAPFIGYYHRPLRNARSAARVTAEIGAVRAAGAQAIQFAELGNLAADGTVARAVAQALGGPGLGHH